MPFQQGVPWINDGPGGEFRQMDQGPRIVEQADPGEQGEAQAYAQLGAVGLSQTEQSYLRQLQYGQQSVQRQIDSGQIRPQQGQLMLQQIQQRAMPLRIRASQLPLLMRRLQFVQLQRDMAHREAMMQENANFRARSLQDRLTTINGVQFMETRPGQFEPLPVGLQGGGGTARPAFTPTQISAEVDRITRDFRTENGREPTDTEVRARLNRRMDLLGGIMGQPASPAPAPTSPTAPTAPSGTSVPNPAILRQLRDGIRQEQRVSDRLAQSIGAPTAVTDPSRRENESLTRDLDEAIDIIDGFRGRAMPQEQQERLRAIQARIAPRLQGARVGGPAVPPPARRVESVDPTYNREETNRRTWEARDRSVPYNPEEYDIPPSIY